MCFCSFFSRFVTNILFCNKKRATLLIFLSRKWPSLGLILLSDFARTTYHRVLFFVIIRRIVVNLLSNLLYNARKPLILLGLFIQTLHCRELIGRISILPSWLSVIIIFACWNAFLDIRDAPWWYRIDVSSLWQTTFPTSIMDNYKRFALSEKNTDKMLHKHYKFFIADFQSKFHLFTKSICHNL